MDDKKKNKSGPWFLKMLKVKRSFIVDVTSDNYFLSLDKTKGL